MQVDLVLIELRLDFRHVRRKRGLALPEGVEGDSHDSLGMLPHRKRLPLQFAKFALEVAARMDLCHRFRRPLATTSESPAAQAAIHASSTVAPHGRATCPSHVPESHRAYLQKPLTPASLTRKVREVFFMGPTAHERGAPERVPAPSGTRTRSRAL